MVAIRFTEGQINCSLCHFEKQGRHYFTRFPRVYRWEFMVRYT